MSRIVTIKVSSFYHTASGRTIPMRSEAFPLRVSSDITKRDMADNGRILQSLRYFSRFRGFSNHLLHKICYRITIVEASNNQSYTTCFTFPKHI